MSLKPFIRGLCDYCGCGGQTKGNCQSCAAPVKRPVGLTQEYQFNCDRMIMTSMSATCTTMAFSSPTMPYEYDRDE